jgi:single-strand DNA-binding protein
MNEYLAKGRQVYIEGRIVNRSYDDKEGNKRYISEVVVSQFQFLGGRGDGPESGGGRPQPQRAGEPSEVPEGTPPDDEDLPF